MKKIGIISICNYYNYGSMLQGYALYRFISQFNDVNCQIINYRVQPITLFKNKFIKMRLLRLPYYFSHINEVYAKSKYSEKLDIRRHYFDTFLKENTNLTKIFYRSKEQLFDNQPVYDIYITGSDQTWNPLLCGGYNNSPMFLDFAIKNSSKAAYAPSLGVSTLTDEQKKVLKFKLKDFKYISCRETNGAKLLSNLLDREIPAVLDPTLLLTKQKWMEIEEMPQNMSKEYIFCYFIGDRKYYREFATQLSKQTHLPIYYIPVSWRDCKSSNNLIFEAGPKEFVGLINHATYVCTDSFHGVAFCSNLGKNFYAFVKHSGNIHGGDNSRLFDYLERIGLTDRLLESYDGGEIDLHSINYLPVEEKLAEERKKSYAYLNELIAL